MLVLPVLLQLLYLRSQSVDQGLAPLKLLFTLVVAGRLPPRIAARLLLPFQRSYQELLFGGKLLNLFVTVLKLLLTLSHLVHQL